MDKKAKKKKGLLDNKRNVLIIAFLVALLSWIIVAGFVDPNQSDKIENAPISLKSNEGLYMNQNLEIVNDPVTTATVTVSGDGIDINGLTAADIAVTLDYNIVTEPGTYQLPVRVAKVSGGTWSITDVEPATVEVVFERVSRKTLTINVQAENVAAANGYFMDTAVVTPLAVEVSGPETLMPNVAEARVVINDVANDRTSDYTVSEADVLLFDASGNQILEELLTIDTPQVSVVFPVLSEKELAITVDITGGHSGFDVDWFRSLLSYSVDSIPVAGTEAALERFSELSINTLDISSFSLDSTRQTLPVTLPEGLKNLDNILEVEVTLDTETLNQRSFEIEYGDINVVNAPSGYSVEPVGSQNTLEVVLVGAATRFNSLLPESIVVEVDASLIDENGGAQQELPVRVYVPSMNRVWSVSSYSVLCNVVAE